MLISNQATHALQADLNTLLKDSATLVCEGADFMLNLNKDDKTAFDSRLIELGRELGCVDNGFQKFCSKYASVLTFSEFPNFLVGAWTTAQSETVTSSTTTRSCPSTS
jgi:hypothetical protein